MPLSAGDKLGPYEILAFIGAGGMGEVYRARDPRLNRDVAIKVSAAQFSERFAREAQATAALNHPGICQVYDVGPNYLVMELVEGAPLKGPLPPERAAEYAAQILDALDAAHKKGITHRDLKPANILVTKQGIKLLDFGLAKRAGPIGESDLTLTQGLTGQGQILGTLQYMSPEQLQSKEVDARSDLFSFGCVLYEMLTGKRAFGGANAASVIAAILEREPAPLDLSPPMKRVIRTCLAKDPDERWQTAREVKIALDPAFTPAQPRPQGWSWWGWAATAILATAIAIALAVVRVRGTSAGAELVRFSINPPEGTVFSGSSSSTVAVPQFALSPDGRAIVLGAEALGGRPMLWLRSLQEVAARAMPGTENAQDPFWSPDSRWIGFFAEGKLKKISAAGGAAQVVADVSDPRGGSWGQDDTILFASGNKSIFRVSATGGTVASVTKLDNSRKEGGHRWPTFLPDGRQFLYVVLSTLAGQGGVYAGSLDGKTKKLLVHSNASALYASPGYLLYLEDDALLGQPFNAGRLEFSGPAFTAAERVGHSNATNSAISASSTGTLAYTGAFFELGRLTWFDRGGHRLDSVGPEGDYTDFRLSPDEKTLSASLTDPKTGYLDIWLTDLARGSRSRITFDPVLNAAPLWSPDGARMVFRANRGGANVIYERSAAGGGTDELILPAQAQLAAGIESPNVVDTDWSPDGRYVIFSVPGGESGYDLWLLPVAGDRKPVKFLGSPGDQMHGGFSPGGHLVAYSSNESGRFEVHVQTIPLSDRKWQVSTNGGYEPRWRADGREIYYLSEDRKLMAVSVGAGPSFDVPKALFQTRVPVGVSSFRTHYVPSRDGRRFLVNSQTSDPPPNPITVVLNWTAGLKK
jgi:eukaryotic-like serine/threonine-protein kinase